MKKFKTFEWNNNATFFRFYDRDNPKGGGFHDTYRLSDFTQDVNEFLSKHNIINVNRSGRVHTAESCLSSSHYQMINYLIEYEE